ncbi:MAG TPA: NADH-quinone oxidoreductase subunit N [Candidatus Dormibacteraeota bacterium]|nr:NADH-quinone oxidoreductase subunit N [Candidatus Dormibacteraeota bacterium]
MPAGIDLNYTWSQAVSDLGQISPIVALVGFFLLAIVIDLALPRARRSGAIAMVAVVGFAYSLATALYRWQSNQGGYAYHRFATGDNFALFFEILFASLGILTVALAHSYLKKRGLLESEFHILIMAAVIGMMVLASATSLVTVFLGLELLSISLYIVCGFARTDFGSQEAAAKYLLVGGVASAFVLFGMALVYGGAGTTVIPDIAKNLASASPTNPLILLGILLMGVGFAFKVSAAPFHMWTPDVYQGAPIPVTAFMSVGTKAAAFAMIVRVFSGGLPHLAPEWQTLLAFVAATSMVVGNLMAIVQTSLKRLLAYSGVAQAGYVLIGVIAGGQAGLAAVLYYLFVYMFMNFGAFAVVTTLARSDGDHDAIDDLAGLGRRNPVLAVAMSVFMLSLAGFPPSVGFFGKLFLFTAGVSAGYTWLVVLAVLMSVVSVFYYIRVLVPVWSTGPPAERLRGSVSSNFAILLSGLASIGLGLYPTTLLIAGQLGANPISNP